MVFGVRVDDNGNCLKVDVVKKKKYLFFKNKQLNVHYTNQDENLIILSSLKISDVKICDLLEFSLPPPLNFFIYPKDVIILRGTIENPSDLSCQSLIDQCATFKKNITIMEENLTVYDVPLEDQSQENNDEESEDENEEFEESDEEIENEEEDDWELEEDEPVT